MAQNIIASTGQETVALQSAFDLLKPQLMNVLFQKYGDQYLPFFNLVMTLGEVKPVAGPSFGHYEGGWIHRAFQVQSNVSSPGVGATQTVQVATSSVQSSTNTVYPRLYDVVRYSNGVTGTIINVANPSTGVWNLTIAPQDTSFTIPAITAGATIIIDSNVFGEGTDQPEGRNNPGIKYLFNTQIVKEAFNITGSAMTDELWYTTDNRGNSAMPYPKGQMEAEYREVLEISQAMLFQVPTNNTAINGNTMTGLFPWAEALSNKMVVTPGTFTVSNFDQLSRVFDKRRASAEYLWAAGPDQFRDVENGLADVFSQNPIPLAQMQNFSNKFSIGDGTNYAEKYMVSWNFRAVQKTGRCYYFTTIPQLAGEQMGGAPGFQDSYRALIIPLDKGIDAKTGNKIARLTYRYKEYGGMNRMMRVWEQGGMAKTPTDGFDRVKYNVLHEGGNQPFGPETWGVIVPGA